MLFKKSDKYVENGYARGGFGTRIYKVLWVNEYDVVALVRLGDTNRGKFKFSKSTKEIIVYPNSNGHWYTPVEAV